MSAEPKRRRFTVDEYHAMARAGVLTDDDRVELLEGEIVEMTPIGAGHAACVKRLNRLLTKGSGDGAIVSVQDPVRLSTFSEPEPDLALLRPRDDFYAEGHPGPDDVLLLVEVAESSLTYDRDRKLPLYARSGVPEVWIVDLEGDRVEVHRAPSPEGYRERHLNTLEDTLEPGELSDIQLPVRGFFPSN